MPESIHTKDESKCGYIPPGRPQKQSKIASYVIVMLQNNLELVKSPPLGKATAAVPFVLKVDLVFIATKPGKTHTLVLCYFS